MPFQGGLPGFGGLVLASGKLERAAKPAAVGIVADVALPAKELRGGVVSNSRRRRCGFDHRSSEGAAGLVIDVTRSFGEPLALVEQAHGLHPVTPVIVEDLSMELIGTAACDHLDLRTAVASEFGRVGLHLRLKLGHALRIMRLLASVTLRSLLSTPSSRKLLLRARCPLRRCRWSRRAVGGGRQQARVLTSRKAPVSAMLVTKFWSSFRSTVAVLFDSSTPGGASCTSTVVADVATAKVWLSTTSCVAATVRLATLLVSKPARTNSTSYVPVRWRRSDTPEGVGLVSALMPLFGWWPRSSLRS